MLVEGYESTDGSVKGFLDFWREIAGWQFIVSPVTSYAAATSTFSVTVICTWAIC
jgi:hypothetical protein